jgi:hypothetical protein
VNYIIHWDIHVLFIAVVCAVLGTIHLGSPSIPAEISLALLALSMVFPIVMMLARAHDERHDRRRQAQYLTSNLLAVLLIASCAYCVRRLLNP